jgi:hypothetical protein
MEKIMTIYVSSIGLIILILDINLLMKTLIGVLSILVLIACDQLIPIPKTPYGFSIGDPEGLLHIEAVLDFQCICTIIQVLIQKNLITHLRM